MTVCRIILTNGRCVYHCLPPAILFPYTSIVFLAILVFIYLCALSRPVHLSPVFLFPFFVCARLYECVFGHARQVVSLPQGCRSFGLRDR